MKKPVVAVVGRPNVGKSTLFNRLIGGRKAIVADIPGVTRDRIYEDTDWNRKSFTLVDTGGLFPEEEIFREEVHGQVYKAIEEAELVLLVVDGRVGPQTEDEEIARLLRKLKKNTILVVNKVDNFRNQDNCYEFISLGLGEPLPVSALHGLNIDQLLDRVAELLPEESTAESADAVRIAVVGRPNVGKSSLINALLQEDRVIVSDVAGTTRDAIDTELCYGDLRYILVDTSGIRKRGKVTEGVEYYSVQRSLRAIDRSDVVLFVLDATQGVVEQDTKIGGYIEAAGKGLIIIVNKWDLVDKDSTTGKKFEEMLRRDLDFLSYAPIIFTSAVTGQGVAKILDKVNRVAAEQTKRVPTGNLNSWLSETVYLNPPPPVKRQEVKFLYAVQGGEKPPVFVFFVNEPELIHFSYKRYLENQLRKAYGFEGTPVRMAFRPRRK